jgi:3-deoxy-D-manno-octulosonate 8-phosphate phosphatase (KDO 8-P phosphatase)
MRSTIEMTLPTIEQLDLLVFDFDGVMTDNRVYVFEDGREAVCCNRGDGLGCDMLRDAGMEMLILSTEANPVVKARANKLKIPVLQGVGDKRANLQNLLDQRGIETGRVMFVGNDLNDLDAMGIVGWPVAPADAHPQVLAIARHTTLARGGDGVVREIAERILESQTPSNATPPHGTGAK